ncbi:hypothetical protein BgiBS90_019343 [Biomphalaria glabrata]|nr:hypothetical protein BgiBS90_019343 [Biomphalaria glabrata]
MNELTEESMRLHKYVVELQLTQFTKEENENMEQRTLTLLEKLCFQFLMDKGTRTCSQEQKDTLFSIFNTIFHELKKNRRILMCQELIEKFHYIRKKLFVVSQSDTCLNYIQDLHKSAEGYKEELQKSTYLKYIPNLLVEIENLLVRILDARRNIKKQQGFEAVTGILSMGSAAAGGALGIASVVAKTGGTVAAGSASAVTVANVAKSATKVVAAVADDAVNAVGAGANIASSTPIAANTAKAIGTAARCVFAAVSIVKEAVTMGKAVSETVQSRKTDCRFQKSFDEVFEFACLSIHFENDLNNKDATVSCAKSIALKVFEKVMAEN